MKVTFSFDMVSVLLLHDPFSKKKYNKEFS